MSHHGSKKISDRKLQTKDSSLETKINDHEIPMKVTQLGPRLHVTGPYNQYLFSYVWSIQPKLVSVPHKTKFKQSQFRRVKHFHSYATIEETKIH